MADMLCPKCRQPIGAAQQAAFCPFCGERLPVKGGPDLSAVRGEADPVKKHDLLLKLLLENPDSLEVAEEILYLGRLYQRGKKGLDYSVIKCYMLNVYLEPAEMQKDRREALRQEIFRHPDLDRCLSLVEDKEAFLRRYLEHLAQEFIRLFLKGSTKYMRSFFGYTNLAKAPKYLAQPTAGMMRSMLRDETLTEAQRALLTQALYAAFAREMNGETRYLDELLQTYNLAVERQ